MKIGMYADGKYSNVCCQCKKEFTGDKRAIQCLECAADTVNKDRAKLYRLVCDIEQIFKLHSSTINPDHKQICIQVQTLLKRR